MSVGCMGETKERTHMIYPFKELFMGAFPCIAPASQKGGNKQEESH